MKTLTRSESARAFCRGLVRGSPMVEVAWAALGKGAEGQERLRHMERIAEGGSCERIAALLSEARLTEPYRGGPTMPEDLQRKLAEGYARASKARTAHGEAASVPFVVTAIASAGAATIGLLSGGILPLMAMGAGLASAAAAKKIPEGFERKAAEDRARARELADLPLCESARLALAGMSAKE